MKVQRKIIQLSLFGLLVNFSPLSFSESLTLNIHCWEGYAKPYTDGFKALMKEKHGIDVNLNITNVSDPDEFWQLARGKQVDLISPAHNIPKSEKWPFIKRNVAAPVDLNNVPNYQYLLPFLKNNPFVTEAGQVFGVPYTMGPYGLAYNADKVSAPSSWSVLWSPDAQGKYSISKDYADANIYISALVLGASYDELYQSSKLWKKVGRDELQSKLTQLATNAHSLWEGTANPDEFAKLDYATSWGYAVAAANKNGLNWKMARPSEGSTMWVDHWVITHAVAADSKKKLMAEEWINYALGVELQVGVIRNWGVSPVVTNLGDNITAEETKTFAVGDDSYWRGLSLWEEQDKRTVNANGVFWENATKGL